MKIADPHPDMNIKVAAFTVMKSQVIAEELIIEQRHVISDNEAF